MENLLVEYREAELIRRSVSILHRNPRLKIADLSERLAISERHLRRLFRRRFGCTPIRYRLQLRLDGAAKQLRRNHYQKFSDVAADWGFSDQAHFTNCFKAHFGVTPTDFVGK
jgi:AraC family transcriptional regulator